MSSQQPIESTDAPVGYANLYRNTSTYFFNIKISGSRQFLWLLPIFLLPVMAILLIPITLISFIFASNYQLTPINRTFLEIMIGVGAVIGISPTIMGLGLRTVSNETGKRVGNRQTALQILLCCVYAPLSMLIMSHFAWQISEVVTFWDSQSRVKLVPYKISDILRGKGSPYVSIDPYGTGPVDPPISDDDAQAIAKNYWNDRWQQSVGTQCFLTPVQIEGNSVRMVGTVKPASNESRFVKCP